MPRSLARSGETRRPEDKARRRLALVNAAGTPIGQSIDDEPASRNAPQPRSTMVIADGRNANSNRVFMDHNSEYFLRRAENHLALAQTADEPRAVRAHYHLAGCYLDLAYGEKIEKAPSIFSRSAAA